MAAATSLSSSRARWGGGLGGRLAGAWLGSAACNLGVLGSAEAAGEAAGCHDGFPPLPLPRSCSLQEGSVFRGTFDFEAEPFDWGAAYQRPNIPLKDLVIAELPVRLFTGGWRRAGAAGGSALAAGPPAGLVNSWAGNADCHTAGCSNPPPAPCPQSPSAAPSPRAAAAESSGLPAGQRGTYAGVAAKVDHLKALGVNAGAAGRGSAVPWTPWVPVGTPPPEQLAASLSLARSRLCCCCCGCPAPSPRGVSASGAAADFRVRRARVPAHVSPGSVSAMHHSSGHTACQRAGAAQSACCQQQAIARTP